LLEKLGGFGGRGFENKIIFDIRGKGSLGVKVKVKVKVRVQWRLRAPVYHRLRELRGELGMMDREGEGEGVEEIGDVEGVGVIRKELVLEEEEEGDEEEDAEPEGPHFLRRRGTQ
jgi:hypothetical protein